MPFADFHTHTRYSDGNASPEAMVRAALRAGFSALGISDHSPTPHDLSYCMRPEALEGYLSEIAALKRKYAGRLEIYAGLEKDAFSRVDPARFDYLIGSVHYLGAPDAWYETDDRDSQALFLSREGDRMELARRYYEAVARHAETGAFQVQGHFDVIAKYGLYDDPDPAYRDLALSALDAVLEKVPFLEVNTGAMARGLREVPYPDLFLLRRAAEKGARPVLSSDAHRPENLAFAFDRAVEVLRAAGFASVWRLSRGAWTEVPL